jgi:hypothetical protein
MNDPVFKAAILPFEILESLAVPCAYERSFKLTGGQILANRYLLAIDTSQVTNQQLLDACSKMNMPPALLNHFQAKLIHANKVALSFEADAEGGALFKVYLEYWEYLRKMMQHHPDSEDPGLLYTGFKWQYDNPEKNLVTEYQYLPGLTATRIQSLLIEQYDSLPESNCLATVFRIIELAQSRLAKKNFTFVEVSEQGTPRKSFDLNLYRADLKVSDIAHQLQEAAHIFGVNRQQFSQLMSIIAEKTLGHISAGIGRDGEEYFSVYYEN